MSWNYVCGRCGKTIPETKQSWCDACAKAAGDWLRELITGKTDDEKYAQQGGQGSRRSHQGVAMTALKRLEIIEKHLEWFPDMNAITSGRLPDGRFVGRIWSSGKTPLVVADCYSADVSNASTAFFHAPADLAYLAKLARMALEAGCSECDGTRTRWYGVRRGWLSCESAVCRIRRAAGEEGR